MLKKITVLAMAVGVLAALALPASASAKWKHGHTNEIAQNVTLGLTGNARFQGGLGGVECQVTSKTTFLVGQTTGSVESFVPHPTDATTNCKGLGGLAFCQVHDVTALELPWTLHTGEFTSASLTHQNRIQVTSRNITSQTTGGFCPVKHINLTPGSPTATPNQPNTISSVQLGGTLQADLTTNNGVVDKETVTVSGALQIEDPAQRNTYSI